MLPFDWPWETRETIWPCRTCHTWRAELVLVEPGDAIWVREWHAVDCPIWAEIEGLEADEPATGRDREPVARTAAATAHRLSVVSP